MLFVRLLKIASKVRGEREGRGSKVSGEREQGEGRGQARCDGREG